MRQYVSGVPGIGRDRWLRVRSFFDLVRGEQSRPREQRIRRRTFVHLGRGIDLTPESEDAFEKLIDALFKHRALREHLPRETIERQFTNAILASGENDTIEDIVNALIASLIGEIKPYRVYVPINGISLEVDSKPIGFNDMVLKRFADDAEFDRAFRAPMQSLQGLRSDTGDQESEEESFVKDLSSLRWRTCLVIEVETGLTNVPHVIFDRVQPVADFWQFCVGTIMPTHWLPQVDYHVSSLPQRFDIFPVIATDHSAISLPHSQAFALR